MTLFAMERVYLMFTQKVELSDIGERFKVAFTKVYIESELESLEEFYKRKIK